MPLDPSILNKLQTMQDYQQAEQEFQLKKRLATQQIQTGGIEAETKKNAYATQVLSSATAGGQAAYDKARANLGQFGIDTSSYAPDVGTASSQLQAARLAQSPLGSLLGLGMKAEGQVNNAAGIYGSAQQGAANAPISAALAGAIGGMNPMMANLVKAESNGNPNAVSPAGAQGIAQILPSTARDPGYGVTPLQGWDGVDVRTAPVGEQLRFGNEYLNTMQERNGGNPQLAAAAYNAGPGAVDRAGGDINKLPSETQTYVRKVAPFSPPVQNQGETNKSYMDRVNLAFQGYKENPDVQAAQAGAKTLATDRAKTEAIDINDLGDRKASLPQLEASIQSLSILGKKASYTVADKIGDEYRRQTKQPVGEGAIARKEYISLVDNQILPLLRQTFGAQFTQKEGDSLKVTLGDPDASPEEKEAVLRSFIEQKKQTINTLERKLGQPVTELQSQAPAGGVLTISSPNDPAFQSLPSGSQFIGPDGIMRVKH